DILDLATPPPRSVALEPTLDPLAIQFSEHSGLEDSAAMVVSFDQLKPERLDAPKDMLLECERELTLVEDPALRIEAGRLCEMLGDTDRARTHYEAALLAEPRTTAALTGLRRMAHDRGDLV